MRRRAQTRRVAGTLMVVLLASYAAPLAAQAPRVLDHHAGVTSPGAIGSRQLTRGGPLTGYFQPVEIHAPHDAAISLASGNAFDPGEKSRRLAGMAISPIYRIKISGIRNHAGQEVFPTLEVIDRTYPPRGQELRHPIPVEITQDDLELALAGRFVTRVIYIEDPKAAIPHASDPNAQSWFEVLGQQNPLEVADRLGRPVAILRIGGRVPTNDIPDDEFLFGSPPWCPFDTQGAAQQPAAQPHAATEAAHQARRTPAPTVIPTSIPTAVRPAAARTLR